MHLPPGEHGWMDRQVTTLCRHCHHLCRCRFSCCCCCCHQTEGEVQVKTGKDTSERGTLTSWMLRPTFSFLFLLLADSSDSHDCVQILPDSFILLTCPNPDSTLDPDLTHSLTDPY